MYYHGGKLPQRNAHRIEIITAWYSSGAHAYRPCACVCEEQLLAALVFDDDVGAINLTTSIFQESLNIHKNVLSYVLLYLSCLKNPHFWMFSMKRTTLDWEF